MSYVTRNLSKDEEVLENIKLHWINYVVVSFLSIIAFLFLIAYMLDSDLRQEPVFLIFVLLLWGWVFYDFLKLYTTERVITNKRVIFKTGIISIRTEELKNSKVESVEIKQTILGRIFGYGNIWFSGTGTSRVKFNNVDDPIEVKTRIDDILSD